MDPTDVRPSLDLLNDAIDDLEEALKPMANMADMASKLPLLDKAKLYLLLTYSVESLLFSGLRLNEVDAKEHPVFQELARVRQYFTKVKEIEFPAQKPQQSLDKGAAIRFIRSDLADNKEINTKLGELIAKERAKAALKSKLGEKRKSDEANPEEKPVQETELKAADTLEQPDDDNQLDAESRPRKRGRREAKKGKAEQNDEENREDGEKREKGKKKSKSKKSKKSAKD
ncbi:Sas10/Utp3/C1D family-domain-containing protein [Nemania sp. FL0916]|nr:Sas10/Utp3/C1D family-domain-containing protein [Nemania sp. FL0916]